MAELSPVLCQGQKLDHGPPQKAMLRLTLGLNEPAHEIPIAGFHCLAVVIGCKSAAAAAAAAACLVHEPGLETDHFGSVLGAGLDSEAAVMVMWHCWLLLPCSGWPCTPQSAAK